MRTDYNNMGGDTTERKPEEIFPDQEQAVDITAEFAGKRVGIKSIQIGEFVTNDPDDFIYADPDSGRYAIQLNKLRESCGGSLMGVSFGDADDRFIWRVSDLTSDGWIGFDAGNNHWLSVDEGDWLRTVGKTVQRWECFRIFAYRGCHYLLSRKNRCLVEVDCDPARESPEKYPLNAWRSVDRGFDGATWERFQIVEVK